MAEDEVTVAEEVVTVAKEKEERPKPPCNALIDRLAKPSKRQVRELWEVYAHRFSPEKKEGIRLLLQELYAMTPEDTSKYFELVNKILKKIAARERLKRTLQKRYLKRKRRYDRQRAFNKFKNIMIKGMNYASKHTVPLLVSPRLRTISDVVLEQLCDIRGLSVPDRADSEKQAQFVLNLADWIAIAMEHVYYEIQVHKNKELDMIEEQIKAEEAAKASSARKTRSKASGSRRSSKKEVELNEPT